MIEPWRAWEIFHSSHGCKLTQEDESWVYGALRNYDKACGLLLACLHGTYTPPVTTRVDED